MLLPKEEVQRFYALYFNLLCYVNLRTNVVPGIREPADVPAKGLDNTVKLREQLYSNPELIDEFVKDNSKRFPPEDIELIRSWKHFVQDSFYIVKQTKDYALFMDMSGERGVYGVLGLTDPIEYVVNRKLPVLVETVLLPYEGRIIYDSIISSYPMSLGAGIRRHVNETCEEIKARQGIITSLPYVPQERSEAEIDAELLRYYLKNESNREMYWEEIKDLVYGNPALFRLYHQEMGKVHSSRFKRQFKKMGLRQGWFAVLEDVIIAGGQTEEEVIRNVESVVPEDKRDFVTVFRYKPK